MVNQRNLSADHGQCFICLIRVEEGEKVTACGRQFHGSCLSSWVMRTDSCPACHAIANTNDEALSHVSDLLELVNAYLRNEIRRQKYLRSALKMQTEAANTMAVHLRSGNMVQVTRDQEFINFCSGEVNRGKDVRIKPVYLLKAHLSAAYRLWKRTVM